MESNNSIALVYDAGFFKKSIIIDDIAFIGFKNNKIYYLTDSKDQRWFETFAELIESQNKYELNKNEIVDAYKMSPNEFSKKYDLKIFDAKSFF